ncbi:MAG: exosortase C-terminal domain/associated protein EpsI [Pseudomonadota bacterium]
MSDTLDGKSQCAGGINIDRRSLVIGAGLSALGALSYLRTPEMLTPPITEDEFSAAIPNTVGPWNSRKSSEIVLPPNDEADRIYENIETRIYEGSDLPSMMLLIAFSSTQQDDIQVHRPEVCYPASGFPILQNQPIQFDFRSTTIRARELLADRGGLKERVVYWVRVGNSFPTTWPQQRLSMAMQHLKGFVPDGTLFRVSTIEGPDESKQDVILSFIEAFLGDISPSFRQSVLL